MFNEPSLIEASWRLFANGSKNQVEEFMEMETIYDQDTVINPVASPLKSLITTRTVRGTQNIKDKLILAPSRLPGAPSINIELYGFGSHGHPNRIGAIQHYEAGNVPLFHNMTRRQTDARFGNIIYVSSNDKPNPIPTDNTTSNPDVAKAGVWYHEDIETKNMFRYDSIANPDARRITELALRIDPQATGNDFDVIVDNFRLVSADGTTTIPLDLCESTTSWLFGGTPNPYSLTTDNTQGNYAVKIRINSLGGAQIYAFRFAGTNIKYFNASEYPTIKYDWKQIVPADPNQVAPCITAGSSDIWLIARMDNVNFFAGNVDKDATVSSAMVDSLGNDCYGKEVFSNYRFTGSNVVSQLIRKQVLTSEGILVLVDEITPDSNAVDHYAASLWHMYSKGASGGNWFDSPGDPARTFYDPISGSAIKKSLLVYHASDTARTFGSRLYNTGGSDRFSTFAKQGLAPNQKIKFVTVLVPHDNSVRAANIANSITVDTSTTSTNISITYPDPLYIHIGAEDVWEVSRTPF